MAQEIITLENLAAEIAKLRGELATWKALAIKQDRLSTAQMLAVNSGATAGKIAQIATNTSDIAALQQIASSAFRVVKVAQLPASGEPYIMYLVPQTDGETLNYCNEYLWIDNAWELVGTTGAMANNGELQIIVNGVTVGTFTANQATDSTASITVPTDTSQLTNGAGYVDATALATALASKQDSLSLTQLAAVNSGITSTDVAQIGANTTAIAGKQDALATSQLAAVNSGITSADVTQIGTNTGNIATNSAAIISLQGSKQNALSAAQLLAVNSGITSSLVTQIGTNQSDITTLNTALGQSLTPSADDTYSLGGASFRYANVYAVTFTGDLTGTASKAIADEDGTSIKTGYVNVAGNQTVSGQKTWSGNQFFTADVYHNHTSYESGNIPANNSASNIYLTDKNNVYLGYLRNVVYTSGRTSTEIRAKNSFKNGVLDPTGSVINSNLNIEVQPDGSKTLYFDGSIRNNVLPYTTNTYSLGSSSYQWASVYAQTYYYNGTAWGLDKSNTWTALNSYNQSIQITANFNIGAIPSSEVSGGFNFGNGTSNIGNVTSRVSSGGATYSRLYIGNKFANGALDPNGTWKYAELQVGLRANGDRFIYTDGEWRNNLIPYNEANVSLGTSTNKWKTLNGINPGALSLPDASAKVQIDIPASWVWDGTTENSYVAPITGWLAIGSSQATYVRLFNSMSLIGSVVRSPTSSDMRTYIPMVAGDTILISGITSSSFLIRIYPCLGNV